MFDAGDRVVWVGSRGRAGDEGEDTRGRVLDDDDGPLTLVMFDGDDEPDEAVSEDLVLETEYDAAKADGGHSLKAGAGYLVYEVRGSAIGPSRAPEEIASCDGDSLAFTLDTLRAEGQINDDARIGILYRPDPERPGIWIVNPYARGRD